VPRSTKMGTTPPVLANKDEGSSLSDQPSHHVFADLHKR
jgi:hypothetical protein